MIRAIIDDLIAIVCLSAFMMCIYVWSTEIGALFYD